MNRHDRRIVEKAVAGLHNPGGGERLVFHGFVKTGSRERIARLYATIADAALAADPATLPPDVRAAVEAYRNVEGGAK